MSNIIGDKQETLKLRLSPRTYLTELRRKQTDIWQTSLYWGCWDSFWIIPSHPDSQPANKQQINKKNLLSLPDLERQKVLTKKTSFSSWSSTTTSFIFIQSLHAFWAFIPLPHIKIYHKHFIHQRANAEK